MNRIRILALLALLVGSHVHAADLSKIERKIAKEPAYQTKAPKYALLVFGPEATTRVWLVQDGETLYVDRNGNGDLTEADESVKAKPGDATDAKEGVFAFEVAELKVGERVHKNLGVSIMKIDYLADREDDIKQFLAKNPKGRGHIVGIDVEMPGRTGVGIGGRVEQRVFLFDATGVFQFAERAADAPIVHFGGPLQIALFGKQRLTAGRATDLVLGVGSPGFGPGTMAWVGYDKLMPAGVYPRVEITYPPTKAGEPPVHEINELKERC